MAFDLAWSPPVKPEGELKQKNTQPDRVIISSLIITRGPLGKLRHDSLPVAPFWYISVAHCLVSRFIMSLVKRKWTDFVSLWWSEKKRSHTRSFLSETAYPDYDRSQHYAVWRLVLTYYWLKKIVSPLARFLSYAGWCHHICHVIRQWKEDGSVDCHIYSRKRRDPHTFLPGWAVVRQDFLYPVRISPIHYQLFTSVVSLMKDKTNAFTLTDFVSGLSLEKKRSPHIPSWLSRPTPRLQSGPWQSRMRARHPPDTRPSWPSPRGCWSLCEWSTGGGVNEGV